MNNAERRLCEAIKDHRFTCNRISDILTRLRERGYKITPSYSLTAGCKGGFSSKVESAALRELRDLDELERLQRECFDVMDAYNNAGLPPDEAWLVDCMMQGYTLAECARIRGWYISHVYKIRDKALQKMVFYLQNCS